MADINELHWCTKCQKVCSGIDCHCTDELNITEVPEEPSDEVLYKDHPEIPTLADVAAENNRIKESGKPYTEVFGAHGSKVVINEEDNT